VERVTPKIRGESACERSDAGPRALNPRNEMACRPKPWRRLERVNGCVFLTPKNSHQNSPQPIY